jgi:hypothetical protein
MKLKDVAVPWVDRRMKDLWDDVVAARAKEFDDGSDLKSTGSAAFPAFYTAEMADADARSDEKKKQLLKEKKALFDALASGQPATFDSDVANECQKKWFAEIVKHHHKPSISKTKNSDMRCWADASNGHVHLAKLFCNSLGLNALKKLTLDDVDVEAIAQIIQTTLAYFTVPQKKAAKQFGEARNACFHAPKPELSSEQFTMYCEHLKGFEAELLAVSALPKSVSNEYMFGEVAMGDDHYSQLVRTYRELKDVRDSLLKSILEHLLPSQSELLRPSHTRCADLSNKWAACSRQVLVNELTKRLSESACGVVHVYGCHGCGKSSLLANLTKQGFAAVSTGGDAAAGSRNRIDVLLHHFFIRNDSAASVEIAVCLRDSAQPMMSVCILAHLSVVSHAVCAAVGPSLS